MIRIGLDIRDSKNPSGVGKYIRELILGLQNNSNINLFLFHDEPREKIPFNISQNIQYIYATFHNAIYWEKIWLPQILNQLNIELYHATNNIGLPWLYKGRKILTIHDLIPFYYPEVLKDRLYWLRFINTLKSDARKADIIIADSISTKNDIINKLKINEGKIKVIWPIEFKAIDVNKSNLLSISEKEAIGIKVKYIIHNGGIDPRKNIIRLLNSYKEFTNSIHSGHCQLVITGRNKTDYSNKVMDYSKRLGLGDRVIFTGEISEGLVRRLLENAEYSVYPSLYEGFGLPVIEAMAAGIPVITSNVSSLPEISGGAALLIDPNNEDEMAAAMLQLYKGNDIRERLIREGKKWIAENAKKDMVKSVTELYMQYAL